MKLIKGFGFALLFIMFACTAQEEKSIDYKSVEYLEQNKTYLSAYLDNIFRLEQEPLRTRDSLMRIFGTESEEANEYTKIGKANHIINEKKVIDFLAKYGWPGTEIIGDQGSLTLSNVIQHSDNKIRIEYLPMMRDAVLKGNLEARFLVRAKDRIATEAGELQVYGGQMKFYPETKTFNVWPVLDPENIDKRRAEIGLGPIAEWLKERFDFEWDLEEQKARTEQFLKDKMEQEQKSDQE